LYVALTRARDKNLVNLDTSRSTWAGDCDKFYSWDYLHRKVAGYKLQDIAKNRHNDLTEEKVRQIIKESSNICYYCRNRLTTKTFTLDRRVESHGLGHTVDNSVCCCYRCNTSKNDLAVNDDMML
jgi:transcription initiation factor IIE alpha subunit